MIPIDLDSTWIIISAFCIVVTLVIVAFAYSRGYLSEPVPIVCITVMLAVCAYTLLLGATAYTTTQEITIQKIDIGEDRVRILDTGGRVWTALATDNICAQAMLVNGGDTVDLVVGHWPLAADERILKITKVV